ncbi:MAG: helix-turn-helix domain-containing protein [Bdellovibrio sp.]|nr:helix-turn-helix domain-containing protein [Bdellovibrio sp.]
MSKISLGSDYKSPIPRYSTLAGAHASARLFDNRIFDKNEDEKVEWLDTDEAAAYLRVTPNALRILVHRARVKSFKLGSRLRFRLSDLLSVLQQKED